MYKTLFITLASTVISVAMAAGCKSDTKVTAANADAETATAASDITRTYNFKDFSSIYADGALKIIYSHGSSYSVKITGRRDILAGISITKENEAIRVHTRKSVTIVNDEKDGTNYPYPTVYITSPILTSADINGACNFSSEKISTSSLNIRITGASKFTSEIKCNDLNMENDGASKINVTVKSDNMTFTNTGASSARIDFKGNSLSIENNGVAKLTAKVDCKILRSDNNGIGKISLSGKANKTDINSSGMSSTDTEELDNP